MIRQSRLQQLFKVVELDGVDKFQCKCCGDSFSRSNAYRHSNPDSPKHCPYMCARDNEEDIPVMEWIPKVCGVSPVTSSLSLRALDISVH